MIKNLLRKPLACALVIAAVLTPVHAEDAFEAALEAHFTEIEALAPDPRQALKAKIEAADQVCTGADLVASSLEDLQTYALLVETAGFLVGRDLPRLRALQQRLEILGETRVFKTYKALGTVKEWTDGLSEAFGDLKKIRDNPDLPPAARETLTALYTLGAGCQYLGENVPLLGDALATYGEIMRELARTLTGFGRNATLCRKEGLFSAAESGMIAGLPHTDTHFPRRTELYRRGVPVVELVPFQAGPELYYVLIADRAAADKWRQISYAEAAEVAADYVIDKGKLPSGKELYDLLQDERERRKLAEEARDKLSVRRLRQRIDNVLVGLPARTGKADDISRFLDAEKELMRLLKGLSIPADARRRDILLRVWFTNREKLESALAATHLRLYADERAYLEAMGHDPRRQTTADLINLHARWRRGDLLPGVIRCEIVDDETERPIAGAVAMLIPKLGQPMECKAPQGEASFSQVFGGEYTLRAAAPGYATKEGLIAFAPAAKSEIFGRVRLLRATQMCALDIRVLDRDTGKLLPGASIAAIGPQLRQGRTDNNGRAALNDLPPGSYRLTVQAEGYVSRSGEVKLAERARSGVIKLARANAAARPAERPKTEPASQPPAEKPAGGIQEFLVSGSWGSSRRQMGQGDSLQWLDSLKRTYEFITPGEGVLEVTLVEWNGEVPQHRANSATLSWQGAPLGPYFDNNALRQMSIVRACPRAGIRTVFVAEPYVVSKGGGGLNSREPIYEEALPATFRVRIRFWPAGVEGAPEPGRKTL